MIKYKISNIDMGKGPLTPLLFELDLERRGTRYKVIGFQCLVPRFTEAQYGRTHISALDADFDGEENKPHDNLSVATDFYIAKLKAMKEAELQQWQASGERMNELTRLEMAMAKKESVL